AYRHRREFRAVARGAREYCAARGVVADRDDVPGGLGLGGRGGEVGVGTDHRVAGDLGPHCQRGVEDPDDVVGAAGLERVDDLAALTRAADHEDATAHDHDALPRNRSIVAEPGAEMPSPLKTFWTVLARMRTSRAKVWWSTYQTSSANFWSHSS